MRCQLQLEAAAEDELQVEKQGEEGTGGRRKGDGTGADGADGGQESEVTHWPIDN